ncbi:MAG: hypothetical protein M3O46_08180 [Myxococcota bacterium]|nr:hypothetical protein [Myxococcota bacterium]
MSIARFMGRTILGCALLITTRAYAADVSINPEARKYFQAGVNFLQDPDGARYEDAYREFEAAYASSPSPKILGNIGYCALKLERDGEAIAAYARYLQEVPDVDPAEAAQINRDLATLRAGLVRVALIVDASEATVVDKRLPARGESITNLYGPVSRRIEIGMRPGHHIIVLKAHGESMPPWEFDAKPGATLSQTFALTPDANAAHPPSSTPLLPWIVTGVGGAALVSGGIIGAITLGKVSSIAHNCPNNQCPATYALQSAQDDARRLVRTTDVLLIGGGIVAATGLWLVISTGGSAAPRSPSSAASAFAQPRFVCTLSGCAAAMVGTF